MISCGYSKLKKMSQIYGEKIGHILKNKKSGEIGLSYFILSVFTVYL